ncbi:putative C-type lectin domain family 20 member A isoform X3 [Narcine bancroftii]
MYTAAILLLFLTHEFPEPSSAEESASSSSWTAAELETAGDDYMPQSLDAALTSLSSSGDMGIARRALPHEDVIPRAGEYKDITLRDIVSRRNFRPSGNQSMVSGDRTFFLIEEEKLWTKAWSYCRNHYTNLASVRNAEEASAVSQLASGPGWIGLYTDGISGWAWTNGDPFGFSKWGLWHPYHLNSSLPLCVAVFDAEWHETDCDFPFPFICYQDLKPSSRPPAIPSGNLGSSAKTEMPYGLRNYSDLLTDLNIDLLQDSNQQTFASLDLDLLLLVDEETQISMLTARNPTGDFPPPRLPTESIPETNSKDYIFVKSEKTWNDAQNYCRAEHTDLASIASLEENAQVAKVLQSDSPAWIGLFNRHQSERSWAWSNGNEFSFSYWDQFYPMDFTAMSVCVIVVSGQWKDTPCDFKFPFVCYAGKGVRYPIPPLHPSAGPELGRWIQGWVSPSEGEEPLGQILGQHGGSHVSTTSWVRPNLFNIRATHDELQAFESYKIQPNITHILIQKYVYIIIFIHV